MTFFDYGMLKRRGTAPTNVAGPVTMGGLRPNIDTDAQETSLRPTAKIIMLGGAIKWWWQATCLRCGHWDETPIMEAQACPAEGHLMKHDCYVWWNSIEHRTYCAWRDQVRAALIDEGYLTYAPWMAFKGTWDERAQLINNEALRMSDAFVILSPDYAITEGTDQERNVAKVWDVPVIEAPPPPDRGAGSEENALMWLLGTLGSL